MIFWTLNPKSRDLNSRLGVSVFYRRVLQGVSRGEWLLVGTRWDWNAMVQGTQGFRQVQAAGA
jgi:hypothetical protein